MSTEHPAPAAQPSRRCFLNGRMRLRYVEWVRQGGPLAILIHGSRDHGRSWDAIVPVLSRHFHVVAPDLRGHGDSAWSQDGRYDYAAYLSDLAALCEVLGVSAERPVTLIGHSLGAHIALRYAGAMPDCVDRVVGIEAVGAPETIQARHGAMPLNEQLRTWLVDRRKAAAAEPRLFASIDEATERMLSKHGYLTRAQAGHLTRHGVRRHGEGWKWKYDPYVTVWPFPELDADQAEHLWGRITCPTLLIFGDGSWPSDVPRQLTRAIADAREVRLPQSGHWPQHDALDDCFSAIADFLGIDQV